MEQNQQYGLAIIISASKDLPLITYPWSDLKEPILIWWSPKNLACEEFPIQAPQKPQLQSSTFQVTILLWGSREKEGTSFWYSVIAVNIQMHRQ